MVWDRDSDEDELNMKKEQSKLQQSLFESLSGKGLAIVVVLIILGNSDSVFGQWQKVLSFRGNGDEIRDIIYFLDDVGHPEIGLASFWNGTFRTSDGGNTWQQVNLLLDPSFGEPFVDITFKDSLTGWTASGGKTTDGGFTWTSMHLAMGPAMGIHYIASTQRLFLSYWDPVGFVSTDEGKTWTVFTQQAPVNGYAFVDKIHGVIGTTESAKGPTDGIMHTSDGGLTWTYNPNTIGCWQPYARKGTSTFFYVSEYDNSVRRSDDFGATWRIVGNLPEFQTGCLKGDLCGNLYAQGSTRVGNYKQMSISSDNGNSWIAIGGPAIYTDSRFYIVGSTVFAQDDNGGVWRYAGPSGTGPSGTSLLSVPSTFSVLSSNCDTQVIAVPFQSLSCYSDNDSLIAASLVSSEYSFQLQSGLLPRQYFSQDSIHVIYNPNRTGQDTATIFLSLIIGGIRVDTSIQIIGNSVRPNKFVALSDSSLSFSSFNCQEADTTMYFVTSGCPYDFDSITQVSITGSNGFTLLNIDTIARKFHLNDSVRIRYNPTSSEKDTARVHLHFLVAGQPFDTVVALYGSSKIEQIALTPGLVGAGNSKNIIVKPGQDVPLTLMLSSNPTNLVGLDSIVFEVDFDSDMLSFDSADLASGWRINMAELKHGKWIFTLVSDSSFITQEITLALLHFTSFLTKDTVSQISLEYFNGFLDPNKLVGCTELSITSSNSVTIRADDTCGDIYLRNFMITGLPGFQIVSIRPNPAFDFLTVDCESPISTEIDAIIYNSIGIECYRMKNNVEGRVTLNFSLNELIPGAYHLLLRSSLGSASTNFIKF